MAHAGRRYRDKQGGYHENRGSDGYEEDRKTRKPSPYNGRPAKDTRGGQHSRASTICSEPYSKASAASQECFDSPPQYYPTKETLSMKCSKARGDQSCAPSCVLTFCGMHHLHFRRSSAYEILFRTDCSFCILKFVEITVNLLVLICVGAAQASVAGFTSVGGLGVGSFNLNSAYSPFEGTELQEVRELDMQITQMRAPCIYGGVTFSLAAAALTLVFLVVGAKPIHRLKMGLLGGECAFSLLAGVCYVIAVGLYLHFVTQVNATEACKRRERLYARRGYTSMNCVVQGGDAAVGLFGVVAACLYFASFVVCILAIRTVRAFQSHMATAQHSPKSSVWDRSVRNDRPTHRTSGSSQNSQALATLV
ncbi:MARVEL domain-containing protein 3-like isoform X2 [Centrocercus urophasianus]|uniref:MARVEL domain-containing protein 3-like isoform X2 n=1 Tax=Centrocercus urophasianus TaxID=9002 RepID=UPI001C653300|nr:MARVEL domain-containing protein 3-like isoform X2 [Centrocercus urophasianus]